MNESELNEIYILAEKLVLNGGQVMREGFNEKQKGTKTKNDFYDMVTVYDKRIEVLFVNGIKEKYSNHKFIGEEDCAETDSIPELTNEPTWIIDPIDGTTNFIKKIPHACISVALTVNKEIVIGIIYNPMLNELYTARKGKGAFLNGEPISVNNDIKSVSQSVVGIEISQIHATSVRDRYIKRLYKICTKAVGTRVFGSAALALAYVAAGQLDVYLVDELKPWDIAAGALIAEEAGATICNPKGEAFNVMKPDIICAASSELSKEIIGFIKEAQDMTDYYFV